MFASQPGKLEGDWLLYRTRQKVSTDRPASLRSFPCNTLLVCFPILFSCLLSYLGDLFDSSSTLWGPRVGSEVRITNHQMDYGFNYGIDGLRSTGPMYFVFCRLYPSSLSHHGNVWLLPVISLLLTNTISPLRACLFIWFETFRLTQKRGDHGPPSI
jgi:hypothetical protein